MGLLLAGDVVDGGGGRGLLEEEEEELEGGLSLDLDLVVDGVDLVSRRRSSSRRQYRWSICMTVRRRMAREGGMS